MDDTEQARLVDWLDRAGGIIGSVDRDRHHRHRPIEHHLCRRRRRIARRGAPPRDRGPRPRRRRDASRVPPARRRSKARRSPTRRRLALCDDRDVLGCVFYVMSYVDGFLPTEPLPARVGHSRIAPGHVVLRGRCDGVVARGRLASARARRPRSCRRLSCAATNALAVAVLRVSLATARRHRRRRCVARSESTGRMDRDDHARRRQRQQPTRHPCASAGGRGAARLGDGHHRRPVARRRRFQTNVDRAPPGDGWPSADELLAHYAEQSGRLLVDLTYYDVLYRFKFAVLTEGIYQRSLSDQTRSTAIDLHEFAGGMIESAANSRYRVASRLKASPTRVSSRACRSAPSARRRPARAAARRHLARALRRAP